MIPVAGALAALGHFFTDGLAGRAALEAVVTKCFGISVGTFGAGAAVAAVIDAKEATPDKAANVGGAGYHLDESLLAKKAEEEDRQIKADMAKASQKMSQPKGFLDPTHRPYSLETVLGLKA